MVFQDEISINAKWKEDSLMERYKDGLKEACQGKCGNVKSYRCGEDVYQRYRRLICNTDNK